MSDQVQGELLRGIEEGTAPQDVERTAAAVAGGEAVADLDMFRLSEAIVGPKQGRQSMCFEIPWPGSYSLTMT